MNTNQHVISCIRQSLDEHLPKGSKALLYGSQARGDMHFGSDWDILILLNKEKIEPTDYDEVTFPLVMLGWDIEEQINPIMYTMQEWNTNRITPFYKNVEQDSIVLYET
jgi:predicted nucleotidyltransferase